MAEFVITALPIIALFLGEQAKICLLEHFCCWGINAAIHAVMHYLLTALF